MSVSLLNLLFVRMKPMCWSVVFKSLSMRLLLVIGLTLCLPLGTTRLMDYPKTLIVLYLKLSHKFICFIESCESRRGILLGTMSTFILVLVVPMVMGIAALLIIITCAPLPNLYWLSFYVKAI